MNRTDKPSNAPYVVALEEHYYDPDIAALYEDQRNTPLRQRLDDLGDLRIREMDEAGIDLQVISHGAPGLQLVNPETAVQIASKANDRLAEAVARHRDRFAAFATLPVPDPQASAEELERAVKQLGFKGAMVHGLTEGRF